MLLLFVSVILFLALNILILIIYSSQRFFCVHLLVVAFPQLALLGCCLPLLVVSCVFLFILRFHVFYAESIMFVAITFLPFVASKEFLVDAIKSTVIGVSIVVVVVVVFDTAIHFNTFLLIES